MAIKVLARTEWAERVCIKVLSENISSTFEVMASLTHCKLWIIQRTLAHLLLELHTEGVLPSERSDLFCSWDPGQKSATCTLTHTQHLFCYITLAGSQA